MSNIDWDFILDKEGGIKTKGYVPDAQGSQSGVTIGGGVDLGARDESDLDGLPSTIIAQLIPYLGLKGEEARKVAGDLNLSKADAKTVTEWAKNKSLDGLRNEWKEATGTDFDSLDKGKATVVASVAFQYGNLATRTPNFWRQTTTGDWDGAIENLRNFGDRYPTRRNSEADYLVDNSSDEKVKKKSSEYVTAIPDLPSEDDAYDDSEMVSTIDRLVQEAEPIVAEDVEMITEGKLPEATYSAAPLFPDEETSPSLIEAEPEVKSPLQELYERGGAMPSAVIDKVAEPEPSEQSLPSARINPNGFRPVVFSEVQMKEKSGLLETIGAMNAYNYAPIFNYLANKVAFRDEVQVGYNPFDDMEGYEDQETFLMMAQNPYHMKLLKKEIDNNRKRREVLYNATFGTSLVAGIFDPINALAIPFGPAGGLVRSSLRSGASVAALQAGVELARAPFDPLATKQEVAFNVGTAFVSGMALGGLVSVPSVVRANSIKKTTAQIDEFRKVLEENNLGEELIIGPSKNRPFVNLAKDMVDVIISRSPQKIKMLRQRLDESKTPEFFKKLVDEARGDADQARESLENIQDGIKRSIGENSERLSKAKQELELRRKEEQKIEELGLQVEDPAGIVENAFTKSWLYKGVTTPVKRFLQSKKLPTSAKLEMVRLAGDSGILLNMHKVGLTNGSSVYQAAQVHNGMWALKNRKLQELWAKDTNTNVRRILDYETTDIGRRVKNTLTKEEMTFEKWLDGIGELYVKNETDLTPLQAEAVAEVRRFFKDWEIMLREENLIGDNLSLQKKVFALEDDIEVYTGRAEKALQEKRMGAYEYAEGVLNRKKAELEEAQDAMIAAADSRVKPANEEQMFPRFWNKEYIKENREALEQILFDWYMKNPYVFAKDEVTGKFVRTKLSQDADMVRGRAKKSVDEILGITDVADDANAFYGYGKSKHLRHRTIDIPNALVAEFIATNPVKVMKAYTARVAPKYEFAKKFGGRNIEEVLDDMTFDMYEKGMTTRQIYAARKDFRHMYDRVAGSVLRDPEATSQRIANVMRFAAESNYLGSAGFSTLPDAAKLVMEHELGTLNKVLFSLLEKDSFIKLMSAQEGKMAGEILEIEMGSAHMRLVEDMLNNPLEQGILDKGRNIAYTLNLLAPMTNVMKRVESLARGHTIIDYSIKVANKEASEFEISYLARYNIDRNKAIEIANSPWQETKSGLYLPNTDVWTDAIQFPATYGKSTSGPTGKFAGDRYVFGTYDKKKKMIIVDEDYIRETAFHAQAWTKPRVAGAKGLDVDDIRTPQEYINFTYMVEAMKLQHSPKDLGISLRAKGGKARYEDRINKLALGEMKRQSKVTGETVQSFREAMNSGIMNTILMGTPADKPIITDGVVYIPMNVAKKFGMKEDAQYTGYARMENAFIGMPFQFMSYSFAAANKITAAYSQGQVRNRAMGLMTSLALGYAVLKIKTPDFVWEDMSARDKFARSFDASGLAALYSDMFYESLTMSSAFGVPNITNGLIKAKFPEDDPYAAVIGGVGGAGPSIVYDQFQAVRSFVNGEYGEGAKNFVRELPYARLWFLRDSMNEMTRGWAK